MGTAFVAHCIVNQSAMASCVARYAGVNWPVIETIRGRGWRIEQIPSCPELVPAGAERGWRNRTEYGASAFLPHFAGVAATAADMLAWRLVRGEDAVLYGVEGSPSTGVHVSWDRLDGREEDGLVHGEGVFVAAVRRQLMDRGLPVRASGETADLPGHSVRVQHSRLEALLNGAAPPAPVWDVPGLPPAPSRSEVRSRRIVIVPDALVNPAVNGIDGLAAAHRTGWGVMQLPALDYPPEVRQRALTELAAQVRVYQLASFDLAVAADRPELAQALEAAGASLPRRAPSSSQNELEAWLCQDPIA
jgi:hypothetical protein